MDKNDTAQDTTQQRRNIDSVFGDNPHHLMQPDGRRAAGLWLTHQFPRRDKQQYIDEKWQIG